MLHCTPVVELDAVRIETTTYQNTSLAGFDTAPAVGAGVRRWVSIQASPYSTSSSTQPPGLT